MVRISELRKRHTFLDLQRTSERDHQILNQILADPFPMDLRTEPLKRPPETVGWLYLHLEDVHPPKQISPVGLFDCIEAVNRIVYTAWHILDRNGERVRYHRPTPADEREQGVVARLKKLDFDLEEGFILEDGLFRPDQAKTLLHYMQFGRPDYRENLWLDSSIRHYFDTTHQNP